MRTNLIKKPVITEKSLQLANTENVYTFEVAKDATKTQIKTLVEHLYPVEVVAVNTVIAPSKRRRVGRNRRMKLFPARKKALIKLKQGQSIELFDIGGEN